MSNWLKDAIVYEIYPQSFYDTNNDGIGDLKGVIEKLDYIQNLGFNAIWLNPVNKSSFFDAGYDVTDYYSIDPRYGTNDDWKTLCEEAHKRNIKVIFDLVPGHTSVDHPWFKESSKAHPKKYKNRYIWTTPGFVDGPGIQHNYERDARYIANFFWQQPSLNYGYNNPNPDNPWELPVDHPDCVEMKEELKAIIKFWMDLGTDGFRVDMAASLIKNDWQCDFQETKKLWWEIRDFIEKINPNVVLIAEWASPDQAIKAGFHLDFLLHSGGPAYTSLFRHEKGRNTTHNWIGHTYFSKEGKGNINIFLDKYLHCLKEIKDKGYIGMITGNHDIPRLAYLREQDEIKLAMVFLFTMPGVPFVYYGDEIGMDYIADIGSKEGGFVRTGSRTPMQWNNKKNHGFSESDTPYLTTDERDGAPTVEDQINDENSLLNFVKNLIALRKDTSVFQAEADLNVLMPSYPFIFERTYQDKKLVVAINPSKYSHSIDLKRVGEVVLSQNAKVENNQLKMDGVSFIIFDADM